MLSTLLANVVVLVHVLIVAILLTGWSSTTPLYFLYLLTLIATLVSETVLGHCFLTKWEFMLRKQEDPRLKYDYSFLSYYGHVFFQKRVSKQFVRTAALFYLWISLFLNIPIFLSKF